MKKEELFNYKDEEYYFELEAYLKVKLFFERCLFHSEGQFAGKPFILNSWQDEFIANVFGLKSKITGLRRYRSAAIWIPKGGGKTEFASGLGLYGACADGEVLSEGYVAAKSRSQADTCYFKGKLFVNNSPVLKELFREKYNRLLFEQEITLPDGRVIDDVGIFGSVSSEGKTQHSKSPQFAILDELWNQTDSVLYSALKGSQRTRLQPLFITISTAGEWKNAFARGRYENDKKCMLDPSFNESHYAVIYEADPKDDWEDEKVWYKANPSLGITPTLSSMRDDYRMAKDDPFLEKDFKQFRLNLWVKSTTAWIDYTLWKQGREAFEEDVLAGLPCYFGCDLSLTTDFTALAIAFKRDNEFVLLNRFYMPLDLIQKNAFVDQVPYDKWATDGFITPCGITEIDQLELEADIISLFEKFNFSKALFDAAHAANLMARLDGRLPYIGKFPQTYTGFSMAAPFFHKVVKEGRLKHNSPVLDWMASHVEVAQSGNFIKPVKPEGFRGRNQRIDGIIASIMALSPFRDGDATIEQTYESGDIFSL